MGKSVTSDYWIEAVACACDEAEVDLPSDKIEAIARSIQLSAEMERECSGYYAIPNPERAEIASLKTALAVERSKVVCRECNGHGRLETIGPHHVSNMQCHKCRGEGKV